MGVLFAQLGDIHFQHSDVNGALFERIPPLAKAISSELQPDDSHLFITIMGDMSYAGGTNEFEVARTFLLSLVDQIKVAKPDLAVKVVIVPGNHDCNFSEDQAARDLMIESLSGTSEPRPSILKELLSPLGEYFNFVATIDNCLGINSRAMPLFTVDDVEIGSKRIRLYSINSPLTTTRDERHPGKLWYPTEVLSFSNASPADLSIVIMHHPPYWFNQEVRRSITKQIGRSAHMVLTAHEHVADAFDRIENDGASLRFVEGGVLQSGDNPRDCSFNMVRINLEQFSHQTITYNWSDVAFERHVSKDVTPFGDLATRLNGRFRISDKFESWLNDPGEVIHHPRCDKLGLSEIFIYPDLRQLDDRHEHSNPRRIRSSSVADTLLKHQHVLITGQDKSGKTCLIKALIRDSLHRGLVPIYLKGSQLPKSGLTETLRKTLESVVLEQYDDTSFDQIQQTISEKAVLFIDDIQSAPGSRTNRRSAIESLKNWFNSVIVFGGTEFCLQELVDADRKESGLWAFKHFEILELGYTLREEMAKRWLSIQRDDVQGNPDFDDEVRFATTTINNVVKNNRLPCFPLYLIILLQQLSSTNRPAAKNGSFGYLYEALTTELLAKSRLTAFDIPAKYNYLATLAYKMFQAKTSEVNDSQMRDWHRQYEEHHELRVSYDKLIRDLESVGILTVSETNTVAFRYRYNYCFFVAWYFSKNIHESVIRSQVRELATKLYLDVAADVMVFLAHLSNDPLILECMKEAAAALFDRIPEATYESDVAPLNKLGLTLTPELPATRAIENRQTILEAKDANAHQRDIGSSDGKAISFSDTGEDQPIVQYALQLNAGFRTINILGQVLRNSAGERSGAEKQVIVETIFSLARRLIGTVLLPLDTDIKGVLDELRNRIMEEEQGFEEDEYALKANQHLFGMVVFASFCVTRLVANATGLEILRETFENVVSRLPALPNKMFAQAIELDNARRNPIVDRLFELESSLRGNEFTIVLLRMLVWHHLYIYDVRHDTRDKICNRFKISAPVAFLDQGSKKLPTVARLLEKLPE